MDLMILKKIEQKVFKKRDLLEWQEEDYVMQLIDYCERIENPDLLNRIELLLKKAIRNNQRYLKDLRLIK